jgi:hypothetical protein
MQQLAMFGEQQEAAFYFHTQSFSAYQEDETALVRTHVAPAGTRLRRAAFNLAIGTTFAFLVRSCLAFVMSLSYIQLAWYTIKRSSRDYTIPDIDKVTSALSNVLVVLNAFTWTKWPLMLLVALLSW